MSSGEPPSITRSIVSALIWMLAAAGLVWWAWNSNKTSSQDLETPTVEELYAAGFKQPDYSLRPADEGRPVGLDVLQPLYESVAAENRITPEAARHRINRTGSFAQVPVKRGLQAWRHPRHRDGAHPFTVYTADNRVVLITLVLTPKQTAYFTTETVGAAQLAATDLPAYLNPAGHDAKPGKPFIFTHPRDKFTLTGWVGHRNSS
jgi:hypothetical protein